MTNTSPTIGKTITSGDYPYTWEWNAPGRSEKGWECPRCGQIWAPWVTQCNCKRSNTTITWTCNTGDCPDYMKQGYTSCVTRDDPNTPHTFTIEEILKEK